MFAPLVTNPLINHELGKDRVVFYNKWNIYLVICETDIP